MTLEVVEVARSLMSPVSNSSKTSRRGRRTEEFALPCAGTIRYVAEIKLEEKHLRTIKKILVQHLPQARVLAFGSRVSGTPRKYSDLDLAVEMPISLNIRTLGKLKDALEDSNLPICVDIVDWHQASYEFRKTVSMQGMIVFQP